MTTVAKSIAQDGVMVTLLKQQEGYFTVEVYDSNEYEEKERPTTKLVEYRFLTFEEADEAFESIIRGN